MDLQRPLYVDGFNDDEIRAVEALRARQLADADDLRRRVSASRALGDMLTPDIIDEGTQVVRSVSVRNQAPIFTRPLFLTFLENLEWVAPTDIALLQMKRALAGRPATYSQFVTNAANSSMGALFELNIYHALNEAFPGAEPQPRLTGSPPRYSDVRIVVGGVTVYVEATALGDDQQTQRNHAIMFKTGQPVGGWGAGPTGEARRIVRKVSEELRQTAPDFPNLLAISFYGINSTTFSRDLAFGDLFTGAEHYGTNADGQAFDLTNLSRVDSIFEFSRDRLVRVRVNPTCDGALRLPDDVRGRIEAEMHARTFMIR